MYPKAIAKNKGPDKTFIWKFADGVNPPATISVDKPTNEDDARPLQALISHLDLDEWEELT
jgi:hypothetical protein